MEYTFGTIADIPALIDMRTAYILEDFGELSAEDEAIMRKTLPDYFSEHLNRDCIAFLAKDGETVVSVALLMILQKPCHPKMIHGGSPQRVYAACLSPTGHCTTQSATAR